MCSILLTKKPEHVIRALSNKAFMSRAYSKAKFSISLIDKANRTFSTLKVGPTDVATPPKVYSFLREAEEGVFILHTHSPTALELAEEIFHPSITDEETLLWHNGMILNNSEIGDDAWDTLNLANLLDKEGYKGLSKVKGSFACVRLNKHFELEIFRNAMAPLFISTDNEYISSCRFGAEYTFPTNSIFNIIEDNISKTLTLSGSESFVNDYNPYGFKKEEK